MTIKADLTDFYKTDEGKEPINNSPILNFCRKLIKDGVSPSTRLEVYRGDVLSMVVKEIGEGAKLAIREDAWPKKKGPYFRRYKAISEDAMQVFRNIDKKKVQQ